ncbi:MAG TPA: DUF1570 domain-containing protein [Bryobacteraceae bacterium]
MLRSWSMLLILLVGYCGKLFAADPQWIKLTTSQFEMYTTNDERSAAAALQIFEQAHSFFAQVSIGPARLVEDPVRIIAFRSEDEYARYRLNPGAFAYYLRNYNRDYIVMQDIAPAHYAAAIHEYTHLAVEHAGLKLPLWVNEGLAEVYSSLEFDRGQVVAGRVPAARLVDLQNEKWLSLQTLLAVDRSSPYYQQPDKMRIFYAQAWALCHMLSLSPAYRPKFAEFLAAAATEKSTARCFEEIYGKSIAEIQREAVAYLSQPNVATVSFALKLDNTKIHPTVSPLGDFERNMALSSLLAARPQTAGEARSGFMMLATVQPGNAEVEESLGYLAWQQGKIAEARLHFRQAFESGSNNATMLCQYASLVEASAEGEQQEGNSARAALLRVLELRPEYGEARLQLALVEFRAGRYREASTELSRIKTVKPEQAYCYYSALAYSNYVSGNLEQARIALGSAKEYANSPEKQQRCLGLLARLNGGHADTMNGK